MRHGFGMGPQSARDMARAIAVEIRRLIAQRGLAIGLLDGSPELGAVYEELRGEELPWTRLITLQIAERLGAGEAGSCRELLIGSLIRHVPIAEFHSPRGDAANPAAALANYEGLVARRPPDFAVIAERGDQRPRDGHEWIGLGAGFVSATPTLFILEY